MQKGYSNIFGYLKNKIEYNQKIITKIPIINQSGLNSEYPNNFIIFIIIFFDELTALTATSK